MPNNRTTKDAAAADGATQARTALALVKAGALQNAILTSANFSIIATDEAGIIQLFNVGAERMLGYAADEVINRISPSDIHDPLEVKERAETLTRELGTTNRARFRSVGIQGFAGDRGQLRADLHLQGRQPVPSPSTGST